MSGTQVTYYDNTEYYGEWFVVEDKTEHYQVIVPATDEQDTEARELAEKIRSMMDSGMVSRTEYATQYPGCPPTPHERIPKQWTLDEWRDAVEEHGGRLLTRTVLATEWTLAE